MAEILYIFEGFGSSVFVVAALLCIAVGILGFKFDKPSVVVVSLLLGFGIGYFLSMAAWGEGFATIYLGSCIGLLSLLVSMKVRPVKRFFLGGVTIFLSVTALCVILINSIAGTTVTYDLYSLQSGTYEKIAISARQNDLRKDMAEILDIDSSEVKCKLSDDKTSVTFSMPSANYGQLNTFGDKLVAKYAELNRVDVVEFSSAWTLSVIIGLVAGIACGILAQFKEKEMQVIGTSIFGGVFGSIFAYLGCGELCPFLIAPLLAVGAYFLQEFINKKKESDLSEAELSKQQAPTV